MNNYAITPCEILLPKTDDYKSWATIACDQFTSESSYWDELSKQVKGKLSTLNLVLPEIYLDGTEDKRIEQINKNMRDYLNNGVFLSTEKGFILTVRKTKFVERRIGLIGAIDLEQYDYSKKSEALIRATEGTIEERIPPRLKIRKNASIEFPHVMVLFDDEKREITERLYENRNKYQKLYDFDLNMDGGHIEGYFIPNGEQTVKDFIKLLDRERLVAKYGKEDRFLFAVGDGNHSLATAKTHWNNIKSTLKDGEDHPARYALCELVNIYDEGIYFEPIYRFIKGVNRQKFIDGFINAKVGKTKIYDGKRITETDVDNDLPTSIANTDAYIKQYITANGGSVDYVHGEENVRKLVDGDENSVAILFDKLDKKDLFKFVSKNGTFPRKTFSMGEGIEKRYYLEGRKIVK